MSDFIEVMKSSALTDGEMTAAPYMPRSRPTEEQTGFVGCQASRLI